MGFLGFVGSLSYISSMDLCGNSRFGGLYGFNCSVRSEGSLVSIGLMGSVGCVGAIMGYGFL